MKCLYCNKIIKLNFFSFFYEDFLLCTDCFNKLEFYLYEDDMLSVIFKENDFIKELFLEYQKGDYAVILLFKDFLEFYIDNYLDCKEIIFFNCDFLKEIMSFNLKGEKRYIFVLYLDNLVLEDILLAYDFDFKVVSLFASKKLINQRKKLLKML